MSDLNFRSLVLKSICIFLLGNSLAAQTFTLTGTIRGKDTGTVILHYKDANQRARRDVVSIQQGQFRFDGTVLGADYALLDTDSSYVNGDNTYARYLFIEPGTLHISFDYGDIGNATITGSKVQVESEAWNKNKTTGINKIKSIAAAIDSVKTLLKEAKIEAQVAEENMKSLRKQTAPIRQSLIESDLHYIRSHPDSYVSVKLLNYLVGQVPTDSIDILYSSFSDAVKNSSVGYSFISYYSGYKKAIGEEYPFDRIQVAERAPTFTLYRKVTDSISLDSFKGTVVLLEFWELSCLPCLQANPLIEEIRKQYSGEELKVIAVNSASQKDLSKLNTYINKNRLDNWMHVSTNEALKEPSPSMLAGQFVNYHGLGVPRTVLIDKMGNVVYKRFGFAPEDIQGLKTAIAKAITGSTD